MSERIAALARRVEDDPFFLASALATFARAEGLDDAQLARRLGCQLDQLDAVRLCRMPRSSAREFQHDVDRIAEAFKIDATVIAEVVRLADSLRALGQAREDFGFLIAARDRDTNEERDAPGKDDEP